MRVRTAKPCECVSCVEPPTAERLTEDATAYGWRHYFSFRARMQGESLARRHVRGQCKIRREMRRGLRLEMEFPICRQPGSWPTPWPTVPLGAIRDIGE